MFQLSNALFVSLKNFQNLVSGDSGVWAIWTWWTLKTLLWWVFFWQVWYDRRQTRWVSSIFAKHSNLHFNLISDILFFFFLQKPAITSPTMSLLLELLRQETWYVAVQKGKADRRQVKISLFSSKHLRIWDSEFIWNLSIALIFRRHVGNRNNSYPSSAEDERILTSPCNIKDNTF